MRRACAPLQSASGLRQDRRPSRRSRRTRARRYRSTTALLACLASCCGRFALIANDAKLGKRHVIELAARRNRSRELELRERSLRFLAEIAAHRAGVEAELA